MAKRTLTARGFARLLARGIRANIAPEHQMAEIERLSEYFRDLAMSRDADSQLPEARLLEARQDAEWLDAIAGELEENTNILDR